MNYVILLLYITILLYLSFHRFFRGMQALIVHTTGSKDSLEEFDSVNYTTTLKWNEKNLKKSILGEASFGMK